MRTLVFLLVLLSAAPAVAQLQRVDDLVVVDAVGQVVGVYQAPGALHFRTPYGLTTLYPYEDALAAGVGLYATTDCSGALYLGPAYMGLLSAFITPDGTVLVGDPRTEAVREVRSAGGPESCWAAVGARETLLPAAVDNVNRWVAPFRFMKRPR